VNSNAWAAEWASVATCRTNGRASERVRGRGLWRGVPRARVALRVPPSMHGRIDSARLGCAARRSGWYAQSYCGEAQPTSALVPGRERGRRAGPRGGRRLTPMADVSLRLFETANRLRMAVRYRSSRAGPHPSFPHSSPSRGQTPRISRTPSVHPGPNRLPPRPHARSDPPPLVGCKTEAACRVAATPSSFVSTNCEPRRRRHGTREWRNGGDHPPPPPRYLLAPHPPPSGICTVRAALLPRSPCCQNSPLPDVYSVYRRIQYIYTLARCATCHPEREKKINKINKIKQNKTENGFGT